MPEIGNGDRNKTGNDVYSTDRAYQNDLYNCSRI